MQSTMAQSATLTGDLARLFAGLEQKRPGAGALGEHPMNQYQYQHPPTLTAAAHPLAQVRNWVLQRWMREQLGGKWAPPAPRTKGHQIGGSSSSSPAASRSCSDASSFTSFASTLPESSTDPTDDDGSPAHGKVAASRQVAEKLETSAVGSLACELLGAKARESLALAAKHTRAAKNFDDVLVILNGGEIDAGDWTMGVLGADARDALQACGTGPVDSDDILAALNAHLPTSISVQEDERASTIEDAKPQSLVQGCNEGGGSQVVEDATGVLARSGGAALTKSNIQTTESREESTLMGAGDDWSCRIGWTQGPAEDIGTDRVGAERRNEQGSGIKALDAEAWSPCSFEVGNVGALSYTAAGEGVCGGFAMLRSDEKRSMYAVGHDDDTESWMGMGEVPIAVRVAEYVLRWDDDEE